MPQAFVLRGGSQDGERLDPSVQGPHPDTLFLITTDDDENFARTGEQVTDDDGQLREVFEYDADGSLAKRARRTFTGHGD
jgi:hypothetical protein